MEFSSRLDRFGEEIFASLNNKKIEMERKGRTIYNLSVGTPDFETPEVIRTTLAEAAKDPNNWKYTLRDLDELKEAVIDYYKRRFDVVLEKDMITSCSGSQEGMGHIGLALCNKGDLVLLPTPCYPAFITCANMAECDIFYYPMLKENNYLPDVSLIPDDVADRAKFMIVSLPSNPMGSVGTKENYEEIVAFAKKHDVLIIHDNAYSDIVFDGVHCGSFLKIEGAMDVGVEFFSLSKSFDVTGARISFLVGRKDVIGAFYKLRSQIDFGMFMPLQKAAIAALKMDGTFVKEQCAKYEERRNALCGGLRNIGWPCDDAKGTMFVWAPVPKEGVTSMEFCMELVERSGVICTPGSSFGPLGEGFVRFALTMPIEKMNEALKAIKDCGILEE